MTHRLTLFALLVLFWSAPVAAETSLSDGDVKQICARATAAEESRSGLPSHLMAAISLAESGRWQADTKANIAWPWTVMTGGKGTFFPTKVEAVAFVEQLQSFGVRNIDVGCMQVNLGYHGKNFASIDAAFDPATNTAFAASLLKGHYRTTRSWTQALGNYHSTTPKLNARYKAKVIGLWNQVRSENVLAMRQEHTLQEITRVTDQAIKVASLNAKIPAIDSDRTKSLNKSLRVRRAAQAASRVTTRDLTPTFNADSAAQRRARAAKRERERLWGNAVVKAPRLLRRQ